MISPLSFPEEVCDEATVSQVFQDGSRSPTTKQTQNQGMVGIKIGSQLDESLPQRLLSQWYLVQPNELPENPECAEVNRKLKQSLVFSHCPRIALPECGKFPPNLVLYGWASPKNTETQRKLPPKKFVAITKLEGWVVSQAKSHRGYWVQSQNAIYWLQDPCTHKAPVLPLDAVALEATTSVDQDAKNNALEAFASGIAADKHPQPANTRIEKRSMEKVSKENIVNDSQATEQPLKRGRGRPKGSKNKKSPAVQLPPRKKRGRPKGSKNRKPSLGMTRTVVARTIGRPQATTETSSTDESGTVTIAVNSQEDTTSTVPSQSQEDVHLHCRVRLGLLSILLDETSSMNHVQLAQFSSLAPRAMLARLKERYGSNDENDTDIWDWEQWQPHSHFIGSYLVIHNASLSVQCNLRLGMLLNPRSGDLTSTVPRPWVDKAPLRELKPDDNIRYVSLALQAERMVRQTPWGSPLSSASAGNWPAAPTSIVETENSSTTSASASHPQDTKQNGNTASSLQSNPGGSKGSSDKEENGKRSACSNQEVSIGVALPEPIRAQQDSQIQADDEIPASTTSLPGSQRVRLVEDPIVAPSVVRSSTVGSGSEDDPVVVRGEEKDRETSEGNEGIIFQFRRFDKAIALRVLDPSTNMKDVIEAATCADQENQSGVFHWSPPDRVLVSEGKKILEFRIGGYTTFTRPHIETLTVFDIAPQSARLHSNGVQPPKNLLDLEVGLVLA
ncbi:expressed unknown protein [Seminavis robusta]|uniref:Uncharacterized protein n=1 Tax=Seminavis robusta TaxID=568900 RepID=A0A9N8EMI4_9STRA|nr:expressed unknown protein [Seminavis robusta]|eukprot:Sro1337_g264150.1 n/a (730) ;mRNA; f:21751-24045